MLQDQGSSLHLDRCQDLWNLATCLVSCQHLVGVWIFLGRIPRNESENREVCIMSYNSRGFSATTESFIRNLVSPVTVGNKIPILCNQENFLLRDNSYKLVKALPGFHLVINQAIKSSLDSGRPRGGMFIAFPVSMKNDIHDVSPGFWRVQAIKIQFKSSTVLLINSYFPIDPRRATQDETELLETLSTIRDIIRKEEFDDLVWTGDINADFARETSHTNLVSEELLDLGLSRSWDDYDVDFTCCHDIAGVSHTSILDHFFWNKGLGDAVRDAGVVHHPDDHSDHCPIFCVLSLDSIVHDVKESSQKQLQKPSWIRASQEERQIYKLHKLTIPESVLECKDVKCRRADHLRDLDMFAMDLLETLQVVAEASLPTPSTRKSRKVIPGWNQVVKPFKDKAYFWHQIWASMGRPINCEIHRVMKSSRNRYHYELKKCRKAEDKVRSSKLLEACLNGDCDIFKQIKTIRTTHSGCHQHGWCEG